MRAGRCGWAGRFQSTSPARRTTPFRCGCGILSAISIHVPRKEDDNGVPDFTHDAAIFQSTSPARRTTFSCSRFWRSMKDFNPRPPQGGRPFDRFIFAVRFQFQSTSPARRTTMPCRRLTRQPLRFQSTSPARRTTVCQDNVLDRCGYFNPRPPQGGRPGDN